jgi:hypothetical protein
MTALFLHNTSSVLKEEKSYAFVVFIVKMLGTCAVLAFTAGAVIQEMSPCSDLYQSTDEDAAIDLGLSNITYASENKLGC